VADSAEGKQARSDQRGGRLHHEEPVEDPPWHFLVIWVIARCLLQGVGTEVFDAVMPFAEGENSRRWKLSWGELEHGVVKLVGRYLQGQRVSRRQRLSQERLRVEAMHVSADREGGRDGGVTRDCPQKLASRVTVRGKPEELDAAKPLAGADGEHDLHLTAVAGHANTRDRIRVPTDEQEPDKRQECELSGKNQPSGTATRGPKRIAVSPAAIPA
jgi:hypothetical protein